MDIKLIWEDICSELTKKISSVAYTLWVVSLEPLCLSGNTLVLVAALRKHKDTINKTYLGTITDASRKVCEFIENVLVIDETESDEYRQEMGDISADIDTNDDAECGMSFNKAYTFDNFVIGGSNQIVYYAAKAVAENPGAQQNPLFIYGGVGLGKTHIMQAIGNHIKEKNKKASILYITTEQFVNEFLDSLQDRNDERFNEANRRFRDKYRKVMVLMIDDIQFISNKKACQEALFHTFNDLYQNNKQIIFTSDRHPKDIKDIEERLLSRFQSGLTVDISSPDLETRIQILKRKAMQRKFVVDNSVLTYIAEKIDSNIRELEGALSKVIFYSTLKNAPADNMDIVREALRDDINENQAITMDRIADITSSYFGISKGDMLGKKKTKQIVEPRQFCIYLVNEFLALPLTAIGEFFGGRDHTTIMYARDKIQGLMITDEMAAKKITDLKNMITRK